MKTRLRISRSLMLSLLAVPFLCGCGGDEEPQATQIESLGSVNEYSIEGPEAEETKVTDFSLIDYPEKGGYFVGDYRGKESGVVIPDEATGEDGVTRPIVGIAARAFYGRKGLRTVVLGDNLRYIGEYAFAESDITDLRVGYGLGDVSPKAFLESNVRFFEWKGMRFLPGINNPYHLLFYDSSFDAISLPSNAMAILLPQGTTEIKNEMFLRDLSREQKMDAAEKNTYTNQERGKHALFRAVGIPDGVTSIAGAAFQSFKNLQHVSFPNTTFAIGNGAFQGCALTSLVIPGCLTEWFPYSFKNCKKLKSVTICQGIKEVAGSSFAYCSALETVVLPDTVSSIGSEAFQGCSSLKTVVLPDAVSSIGSEAFQDCSSLTSINIPADLSTVGANAFKGCPSMFFHEYEGNHYIGPESNPYACLYEGLGTQPEVCHIHPDCKAIPSGALYGPTIQELVVPKGCSLGQNAVRSSALKKVTFLGAPSRIDNEAFADCSSLVFSSYGGCRYLGNEENQHMVLYDVTNKKMKSTAIHEDCIVISVCAFDFPLYENFPLRTVVIPSRVERIGGGAFADCTSLTSVTIQNAPVSIGAGAFSVSWNDTTSSLSSVSLGNAVKSIGEGAFKYCKSLKSIALPNTIPEIPDQCFYGSALTSISIPSSVTSIGQLAFASCKSLSSVYLPSSVETIASNAFSDSDAIKTVNIEASSRPDGWKCTFPSKATVTYGYKPA